MPSLRKSRFAVAVPFESGGERLVALYQTLTGAFLLFPERGWKSIMEGSLDEIDPETPGFLLEQGVLANGGTDEGTLFERWKESRVHDFSHLKSKVVVTRRCNNRCRYCIVDAEAGEMSAETAWAMDAFYIGMIREKSPKSVQDEFSGGEPFLNPGIILESASRRYFFCLGKGIEYSFSVVNNGTLINPLYSIRPEAGGIEGSAGQHRGTGRCA